MSQQGGEHAVYCYARALLDLVVGDVDDVYGEVESVVAALLENEQVREFFSSPAVSREDKVAVLRAAGGECSLSAVLVNFFCVVVVNGRFASLSSIFEEFCVLFKRKRGLFKLEIITASAISQKEEDAIVNSVKKVYGVPMSVVKCLDPEILGGFIVKGDSFVVDASFVYQLRELERVSRSIVRVV